MFLILQETLCSYLFYVLFIYSFNLKQIYMSMERVDSVHIFQKGFMPTTEVPVKFLNDLYEYKY